MSNNNIVLEETKVPIHLRKFFRRKSCGVCYICHLVEICREVRRVLRPDGVFWLNCGDSWNANYRGGGTDTSTKKQLSNQGTIEFMARGQSRLDGVKPLDMVLIPEQLALALRADGWYLRSILIWAKGVSLSDTYNGNPMPESVNGWRWEKHKVKVKSRGKSEAGIDKYEQMGSGNPHATRDGYESEWQDCSGCPKCEKNGGYVLRKGSWRATDSFEYILMLTKTRSYFCDREAVLEKIAPSTISRGKVSFGGEKGRNYNPDPDDPNFRNGSEQWGRTYDYQQSNGSGGRNLRSVLMCPTKPYKGAHFATFSPDLITPLIKAATSEKGCCPKCSSPWARVIDRGFAAHDGMTATAYSEGSNANRLALLRQGSRGNGREYVNATSTIGWLSTCQCGIQETEPCRVLDPFSGAGTTALVAERLGLDSIGIDTSAEYIQLSKSRLAEDEQKRIDEFIKQAKQSARKQCARKSNTCSIDIYNLQV